MNPKTVCYFILALLIIVFIACGDSGDDEDNSPTKPTTQTQIPDDEVIKAEEEVDFAAEEAAIRELYTSYTVTLSGEGIDEIMEHWIKRETKDVFMVQCFVGAMTRIEKWKAIKNSWEATFVLVGRAQLTVTIEKVGIDKRGQKATLRGTWKWGNFSGKMVVAFEKDKKGNWKIRATDNCDKKFIKEIQTPQPQ